MVRVFSKVYETKAGRSVEDQERDLAEFAKTHPGLKSCNAEGFSERESAGYWQATYQRGFVRPNPDWSYEETKEALEAARKVKVKTFNQAHFQCWILGRLLRQLRKFYDQGEVVNEFDQEVEWDEILEEVGLADHPDLERIQAYGRMRFERMVGYIFDWNSNWEYIY